jgi:CheY-like chemotaxis protein
LVVEDVFESRLLLRQILGRLGVTVIEATDGLEGVEAARRELPDLILMDLSLPVLDGWEATRRLKADPLTARIPIVIVTAHSMSDEARRVKEIGCAGYVMKPLDPIHFGSDLIEFLREGSARNWLTAIRP